MTITLHSYYGILAHEKTPTFKTTHLSGEITDSAEFVIPDSICAGTNWMDQQLVELPGLGVVLLDEVLRTSADGLPVITWHDGHSQRFISLSRA